MFQSNKVGNVLQGSYVQLKFFNLLLQPTQVWNKLSCSILTNNGMKTCKMLSSPLNLC